MTWVTERNAIMNKFSNWTASRVKYPNVPFQEPNAPWIAPHILNGEAIEATMGPSIQRDHVGVVSIQVLDRENQGEVNVRILSDQLELLFIGANARLVISPTEYIDFAAPALSPAQIINGWYQRNVLVPYTRSEFK